MNCFNKSLIIISVLSLIVSACSGKYPGFDQANNGVYYQVHHREGDTSRPKITDWVTVKMDYRLEDTTLFKSTMLIEPLRFPMIKSMFAGDLYQGLELMGEGDSMTFVIVADSFFFKTVMVNELPPYVKPGSLMYYDVKLLKHISNEEYMAEIEREKEELRQIEASVLANFIQENQINELPLESGLYFIPLTISKGRTADTGEMCQVFMEVKLLDGTVLFSNFNSEPIDIEYGKEFDTKGLMEGLGRIPVGGKARLIVPSSIGVGETGKESIKPFTTIIYEVQLLKLRSVEEVKIERDERKRAEEEEKQRLMEAEPLKIEILIKNNNIQIPALQSGLYFISLRNGVGDFAKAGDKVKVHYTLFSIDGEQLESSLDTDQPFEFEVGKGQVIKGWEEAILMMNKGAKAKLIIPSNLAYGAREVNEKIQPFTPLVFDFEIIEIE